MESNNYYAVYGTLRKDGSNHHHLSNKKGVTYVGTITSEHIYTMKSVGDCFPALFKNGDTSIVLEIYDVQSAEVERSLDALEGYSADRAESNNYYNKDIINTPLGPAFVYFFNTNNNSTLYPIENGDWVEYIKNKQNDQN